MPRRSSRWRDLTLACASLAVSLAVAEAVIRWFRIDDRLLTDTVMFVGLDPTVHQESPDWFLHYELKPNAEGTFSEPGRPSYHVHVDRFGARYPTHPAEKAPGTVKNFLQYVEDKHYDNTIFHRVISTFMIQGGGFQPGLREKKTRDAIKNEADNGLKNERGTLAMARTSEPHSATAQFFINLKDNGFLNHRNKDDGWGYCVFGKVVAGMDVVDKIKAVRTGNAGGHQNVPVEDVVIKSVRREQK